MAKASSYDISQMIDVKNRLLSTVRKKNNSVAVEVEQVIAGGIQGG